MIFLVETITVKFPKLLPSNINFINIFLALFSFYLTYAISIEYTEYAQIEMSDKGHRRLWLNGHKFGSGEYHRSSNETVWKCTRTGILGIDGVKKRCKARMKSKNIRGYEMVKSSSCVHDHD